MKTLKGSIVALITPFNEDGSVNFSKLDELLDWHLSHKTDGLVILGTTGEASTTLHEEDDDICRFTVKKVNGRIPVIAGGGSNCTTTAMAKSKRLQDEGVDGLLLISPYYNKANEEGMYRHFASVADNVDLPIILYNVPGRTGCSIPETVVEKLSKHQNITGIKEASGNISYTAKIARYLSDDFVLYSGNDDMVVPVLSLGGQGVISVFANIMPDETHDMVMDFLNGDVEKAREAQIKYLDLINALFIEVNPIPVKEAMNLMGMNVGGYRLPLCEMSEQNRNKLACEMRKVGLIK
ncbi:MAG: 4-hydroxy-tetrahydrodipicolinate synthase [Clostridia bacterium]|nr:4-hydroxy-tetrahydrodipicolinate synthase [Clostridia bacterium]